MADALPADLNRIDPADAWKPWVPSAAEPWDRKRAAHLFRRAAFGATPEEIDAALTDGFPKTLDRLLAGEPDAADRQELLTETGRYYTDPGNLRVWWLYAMVEGGHPLREKLTLFWHNHFATSYAKVRSTKLMFDQNLTLRKHALGRFRPFLLDMSKDTAMLVWLDSNRNVKGGPNENFAREVMELFSLGVGNYTEADVREAARAFTGWHHDAEVSGFENNPVLHDDGVKTVLGRTGRWTGTDVVRICCDHPACAAFLARKLYAFFVSETPPPDKLVEPLADRFRRSDYDIAELVKAILGSRLFFSPHAYQKRVKWPVEYALGATRAVVLGRVPLADFPDPLAKMGQVLFAPPNVKGWRTGTDWLNSATLLARNNFAETVALGQWSRQSSRPRGNTARAVAVDVETKVVVDGQPADKPAPPPPAPDQDPVTVIYATNPKDIPAVVRRMGELLYGEAPPAKVAAKIEAFLRQPGPEPGSAPQNAGGPGDPALLKIVPDPAAVVRAWHGKSDPPAVAPPPREARPKPYTPDLASDRFKARVREALHAMMCLPEYQLN
jgi:uncharacterized protein (DUF1800 family)